MVYRMEVDDDPKVNRALDPKTDSDDDPDWAMVDGDLDDGGDAELSATVARTTDSEVVSILSNGTAADSPSRRTPFVNDGAEQTPERKIVSKCNNNTARDAVRTDASIEAVVEASREGSKHGRHPGTSKRVSFRCSPRLSRRTAYGLREKWALQRV